MDKMCKKESEQLIGSLQERLKWLVNEATDEEFDVEEIRGIINQLRSMRPIEEEDLTPESGLARFWKTLELREQIKLEMEKMGAGKSKDENFLETV